VCAQVAQDILVLVTADVSEAARAALREVFDEVVGRASTDPACCCCCRCAHVSAQRLVEPIVCKSSAREWARFKERYKWIDSCFTKLRALQLEEYKKAGGCVVFPHAVPRRRLCHLPDHTIAPEGHHARR
jgi:hypothetical protein